MSRSPGAVVVTGGCGFIGHHLVRRLLRRGRRVVVVDDLSTGRLDHLPAHDALTIVTASVLDEAPWRALPDDVEAVYHLAGVVGMRLATRQAEHAYRVAVEGVERALAATGEARFVLFSSSAVYGLRHADPARESTPLDERDTLAYDGGSAGYATGKLHAEQRARDAAAAGREVLVVRPFNVVGPRQSSAYGMVLPTFVEHARAGRPLEVHDDGLQTRAFSDVEVFLDCLERLTASRAAWEADDPVFNLGTPRATSILELAREVLAVTASDADIAFRPYAESFPGRSDVRARVPDVAKLEAVIGAVDWPTMRDVVTRLCAERQGAPARPLGGD